MSKDFIPEAGDIIWLELNRQAGHEQAGRRPALVISPSSYNSKTSLALCCTMTTKIKGYPFEVLIDSEDSVVLADHVKSLDWKARKAKLKTQVSEDVLNEVRGKLQALIRG